MKHWTIEKSTSHELLTLNDGANNRVIGIETYSDTVLFIELCDQYFSLEMSKDEAICALEEAIKYIEKKC